LLGAYERACELAEQKARLAGVFSPVSALHKGRTAAASYATSGSEIASLVADSSPN
jgi:hypothetical protein